MRVLETALARQPNHPGAIHPYTHTAELGRPELAEAAAERLLTLAPGAGSLVHMPSRIFRRLGRYADASRSNEMAIAADESPDWHVPVRPSLGAVLLVAGRAAEAEAACWQELNDNPENGWALFGLMQRLRAQGKEEQAAAIERRHQAAWSRADVKLTASRFMGGERTVSAE